MIKRLNVVINGFEDGVHEEIDGDGDYVLFADYEQAMKEKEAAFQEVKRMWHLSLEKIDALKADADINGEINSGQARTIRELRAKLGLSHAPDFDLPPDEVSPLKDQIAVLKAENQELHDVCQSEMKSVFDTVQEQIAALKAEIKSHKETESDTISRQAEEIDTLKTELDNTDHDLAKTRIYITDLIADKHRQAKEIEKLSKTIPEDIRSFIYTVTLFLQASRNKKPEQMDQMFHRAYHLYVKYDVEGRKSQDALKQEETNDE